MNRKELARFAARRCGITEKEAADVIRACEDGIREALSRDEEVRLQGFGTFSTRRLSPRVSRNPSTGERVLAGESRRPVFRYGSRLLLTQTTEESNGKQQE